MNEQATRIMCNIVSCRNRTHEGVCDLSSIHLRGCAPEADNVMACSEFSDTPAEPKVVDVLSEPWESFAQLVAVEQLQRKMDELVAIVRSKK